MRNKILIVDEISKPAEMVLRTAKCWGDAYDNSPEDVYDTPFKEAWTKTELKKELRWIVQGLNENVQGLKLKQSECRIVAGSFIELDSHNMSHAGAYYVVAVEIPRRATKLADFHGIDHWNSLKELRQQKCI